MTSSRPALSRQGDPLGLRGTAWEQESVFAQREQHCLAEPRSAKRRKTVAIASTTGILR
ncbi:hypothetical protein [Sinomonas terrae]|uniref:Uncharacterized protein n=1 Tax=Sinomonas terrae TaxID=2908838 RepID=A0ABS9U6Y3_9MICC|nr:hypothetical protein [Sinomonas terrae]MCH6472445.1 hypothetical protein [Sinomonas terrae]